MTKFHVKNLAHKIDHDLMYNTTRYVVSNFYYWNGNPPFCKSSHQDTLNLGGTCITVKSDPDNSEYHMDRGIKLLFHMKIDRLYDVQKKLYISCSPNVLLFLVRSLDILASALNYLSATNCISSLAKFTGFQVFPLQKLATVLFLTITCPRSIFFNRLSRVLRCSSFILVDLTTQNATAKQQLHCDNRLHSK